MSDPSITRQKESASGNSMTFPIGETLLRYTALRFVEYSRLMPADDPKEQTTAVIFLPFPVTIPDNKGIRVGNISMVGLEAAKNISKTAETIKDQGSAPLMDMIQGVMNGTASRQTSKVIGSIAALAPKIVDLVPGVGMEKIGVVTGVVRNPHTTMHFEGVENRAFTLSWRMSARSLEESLLLKQITDTITSRSHPEEQLSGLVLDYPDLVYVKFLGDSSDYLPVYNRCMISNIQISYGNNQWYTSGAPMEVELSVSFTEIEILTRNKIEGRAAGNFEIDPVKLAIEASNGGSNVI